MPPIDVSIIKPPWIKFALCKYAGFEYGPLCDVVDEFGNGGGFKAIRVRVMQRIGLTVIDIAEMLNPISAVLDILSVDLHQLDIDDDASSEVVNVTTAYYSGNLSSTLEGLKLAPSRSLREIILAFIDELKLDKVLHPHISSLISTLTLFVAWIVA